MVTHAHVRGDAHVRWCTYIRVGGKGARAQQQQGGGGGTIGLEGGLGGEGLLGGEAACAIAHGAGSGS